MLHRVLIASTKPGDTVLDPFFGTGTTGAVAKRLGRNFIGIERDVDYAKAADERIAKVQPLDLDAIETLPSKRSEPRIPFGQILELGIIEPGRKLFDSRREVRAEVARGRHAVLCRPAGVDSSSRRYRARQSRVQWLDVLAFRGRRKAEADRRASLRSQAPTRIE